jgi:hypothetical protein
VFESNFLHPDYETKETGAKAKRRARAKQARVSAFGAHRATKIQYRIHHEDFPSQTAWRSVSLQIIIRKIPFFVIKMHR